MVSVPVPSRLYCNTSARSTRTGDRPLASARAQNGQEGVHVAAHPSGDAWSPSRSRRSFGGSPSPEHLHRRVDRLGGGLARCGRGDIAAKTPLPPLELYFRRALNLRRQRSRAQVQGPWRTMARAMETRCVLVDVSQGMSDDMEFARELLESVATQKIIQVPACAAVGHKRL